MSGNSGDPDDRALEEIVSADFRRYFREHPEVLFPPLTGFRFKWADFIGWLEKQPKCADPRIAPGPFSGGEEG
jgi:hypothetical protein